MPHGEVLAADFNPRPTYGERHWGRIHINIPQISIHAPHTRSDQIVMLLLHMQKKFQSTPLIRGATASQRAPTVISGISIHAPHTRSDVKYRNVNTSFSFQSTPLIRGATQFQHVSCYVCYISIHAPHTRSDGSTLLILVVP